MPHLPDPDRGLYIGKMGGGLSAYVIGMGGGEYEKGKRKQGKCKRKRKKGTKKKTKWEVKR
jgi:hypothetical protein